MRILLSIGLVFTIALCLSFNSYSQDLKKENSKISSALSYAIDDPESDADSVASRSLTSSLRNVDEEGNIRVYIRLYEFSDENLEKLKEQGVVVEIYDESQNLVQGKVATENVEAISNLSFVKFVDLPHIGSTNAGSVQTEGDAVLNADETRSTFGVDGSGIKVGVVSDGINGLTESVASGDIPPAGIMVPSSPLAEGGVSVNDPCPSFTSVTSTPAGREDLIGPIGEWAEGLAMLEIIHDIAPGAELYFASGFPTTLELQRAKKCLTEVADIIADDLGAYNGPFDGTSPVSLQSTASVQAGVANFIAVGNDAQRHYQGVFTDTDDDGFHEFDVSLGISDGDPTTIYGVSVPALSTARLFLQWNDQFGASNNDYDMIVVFPDLSTIISNNIQDGDGDPFEFLGIINPFDEPLILAVLIFDFLKFNGLGSAQPREFDFFHLGAQALTTAFVVPESSVPNNSDADLVCSVGSIGLGDDDPQGLTPDQIRSYSSRGPTNDGRLKPDLVAPDQVTVTGNGGFGAPFDGRIIFPGTSAAAPHAAGVAALLLEADNSLTPAALTSALQQTRALSPPQVADILSNTAVDLGPAGPDNTFGFGRIDALAAVQSVVQAGPGPTPTPTATPTSMPPGDSDGSNGDDGGGGCSVGGSVSTATTLVNLLIPILTLIGFGFVRRFRRIL